MDKLPEQVPGIVIYLSTAAVIALAGALGTYIVRRYRRGK